MTAPEFVHLHVHSEYSLLDGANRIERMVEACKADGQPALALTDHGNMFGALEFYQACTSAGIKPIIGCEVYIAKRSRLQPHDRKDNGYSHLTLLARDAEGYRNLLQLATLAYTEGLHFRPRIDKEVLSRHARGLTCLSGCLSGEINQQFRADKPAEAERIAGELRDLFGPEHFWLELQRNGIEVQDRVNEDMHRLHQRLGTPLIATNDIHYLRHEDCAVQDVLLCIHGNKKRSDEKRFRMDTDTLFFRTREEMGRIFHDLPEALSATHAVADQIDVKLEFGSYHLPIFTPESGESSETLFDRLCEQGLERWYGAVNERARERLEYEKRVIRDMGFVSYFLIVWDLIRWAREHDIPVGPGRGSAAGSLVAYVLGITQVDPLRYDLLFERFLNSARISMPDIDIDFCKEGRERVLRYTRERYGSDHVAQIVTFGTMAARTAVRDVGRVLDLPLAEVDRIAKLLPQGPGALPLAEALESDKDLRALREARPDLDELFELSQAIEGMPRHISTHAAGVVIADRPISHYVPLATHDGEVVTQWPGPQLEQLGLLKMDYLGLRTLTIIARTLANIRKERGQPPELDAIPLDDPATYRMLTAGDTLGVFQLESEGMRKLLARLKPDRFEDLIAVLALYRPGPLQSKMDEMFIRRKHGQEAIAFPHPSLEPILRDTYGCIVYQEQVMLISNVLSSFSLNEADNLRKAMGKKKPEILAKFASKFVAGAVANGCSEAVARETWDNIEKFGGYGFNKSHSTAYALITLHTAYLKANHRSAFLAANMSCEMHDSDKIKAFVDDARRCGVELRGPDVLRSGWEFEPEEGAIRFGLGAVKGTGERAIQALVRARGELDGPASLHALCAQVEPNELTKLTWEALIKAGAFDALGEERGALFASVELAVNEGAQAQADRKRGQSLMFGEPEPAPATRDAARPAKGASWTQAERLRAEFEVLGFYLSGHPLEERAGLFSILSSGSSAELSARSGGQAVHLAGLVRALRESVVKNGRLAGQKMARFQLEDLEGSIGVTCFPRTLEAHRALVQEDQIVLVVGKLDERAEPPGILADEIYSIEDALARFDGGVWIYVTPEDAGHLDALGAIVARHRGNKPLSLQVLGEDGRLRVLRASDPRRVKLSAEFAREVDQLLGRGRVRLAR